LRPPDHQNQIRTYKIDYPRLQTLVN
jgi:hypothetical protein